MRYTVKVLEKYFYNEVSKQAYLDVSKWLAQKIISRQDEIGLVSWNVSKVSQPGEIPCFKLTLFVDVDEETVRGRHCEICKQVHNLFYMNHDQSHCSECKLKSYFSRLDEEAQDRMKVIKEKIKNEK